MMNDSAFFDFEADYGQTYDALIRRVFPSYEHLHEAACALLGAALPAEANVLVAGAGGGMELCTFGSRQAGWRLTGIDPSGQMLAFARRKVERAGLQQRVKLLQGYVHELEQSAVFDGAACMLVLHFLPDDGGKLGLLQQLAARLKSGGALLLVSAAGARDSDAYRVMRRALALRLMYDGMSGLEAEALLHKAEGEMALVPSTRIEELLREAGFSACSPFFRELLFEGWIAFRD